MISPVVLDIVTCFTRHITPRRICKTVGQNNIGSVALFKPRGLMRVTAPVQCSIERLLIDAKTKVCPRLDGRIDSLKCFSAVKHNIRAFTIVALCYAEIDCNIAWIHMFGAGRVLLSHVVVYAESIVESDFFEILHWKELLYCIANLSIEYMIERKVRFVQYVPIKCVLSIAF